MLHKDLSTSSIQLDRDLFGNKWGVKINESAEDTVVLLSQFSGIGLKIPNQNQKFWYQPLRLPYWWPSTYGMWYLKWDCSLQNRHWTSLGSAFFLNPSLLQQYLKQFAKNWDQCNASYIITQVVPTVISSTDFPFVVNRQLFSTAAILTIPIPNYISKH